jgi:hypothetical protein
MSTDPRDILATAPMRPLQVAAGALLSEAVLAMAFWEIDR